MSRIPPVRKRVRPYTKLYSSTIRDQRISYRALGVLLMLLDLPEDWTVRAENLAAGEGREGRDAVGTALRELAAAGYYRVERRRLRSGRFMMGTAVSDEPVESWATEYVEFRGKPIPLVEQADGSFMVLHGDESLTPDGFGPEHAGFAAPDDQAEANGGESQGQAGSGFSGTGNRSCDSDKADTTGSGFPGPGFPGPGEPGPGMPCPLVETEKENREVVEDGVLAVGELTVANAREAGEAPSAQPDDPPRRRAGHAPPSKASARSLLARIPRYRSAPGWVKAKLVPIAMRGLEHFDPEAIVHYAAMVVGEGQFAEHQHAPELREAVRRLSRDVALGTACAVHGCAADSCPCRGAPATGDRPWTDEDAACLERALDALDVPPEVRDACSAAVPPTGTES
jgi:hypothetical protein